LLGINFRQIGFTKTERSVMNILLTKITLQGKK